MSSDPLELAPVVLNRALIIDDDRDETAFLKALLEQRKKLTVDVARDGGQAQSAFQLHPPDIVILDVMLRDDISGFEVCERLKRLDARMPVIMLTAIDMDDARDLAIRVGVDAYLTKPYDPEELLTTVQEVAERVWSRNRLLEDKGRSEKVRVECPACNKKIKVSGNHRGHRMMCPSCGASLTVPLS